MHLSSYSKNSLLMILPMIASLLATLAIRALSEAEGWAYWIGPVTALPIASGCLLAIASAFALDSDDRLIGRAVLDRVRALIGSTRHGASA